MHVDFEERVDFDRLRTYRLARARDALRSSELGALLSFDMNNIRYLTSTNIGEWARDKLMRFAVLAGDAIPCSGTSDPPRRRTASLAVAPA
jgi:Xaa-Pro dipeptidase